MPSGYVNGVPNPHIHEIQQKSVEAHKGKPSANNKINKIIEVVTDALSKPLKFLPQENLATTFNIQTDEVDPADICIALLNLDVESVREDLEAGKLGSALGKIIYRINSYLPDDVRVKTYRTYTTLTSCSETDVKIRDFIFTVVNYCTKIEDKIARTYYMSGKMNQLEILKRRYKRNWGDSNGKSVEVKSKDTITDNTITITIKDA